MLSLLFSRQSRRRPDESGVTLVEILVVFVILGVIGGVVTSAVVTSLRSATLTNQKIEATQELEIATQRVTRDLRASENLTVILSDPDDPSPVVVGLLAMLRAEDGSVFFVSYEVSNDQLIRLADGQQLLVTAVGNAPDDPVFTCRDALGDVISCGAGGLSQVGIRLVREIEGRNPAVIETIVSIRNLRWGTT